MSVRMLEKLKEKLADGVEPVAAGGAVERLRRVKDEEELAAIAAASELADEVWRWSLERGLAGRSERDVARAAEARIRELGADPSFPAIVAAGPNGALPHAEPGEREIGRGELVVFDMGAQARRLLLRRHPHLRHRRAGGARPARSTRSVREAQAAALDAIAAGANGEAVDAVARKVIDAAGSRRALRPRRSATASGSRSTRGRGSRSAPTTCSSRAKSSRSSRASTCPASSG